jgi:glycosyltransferase involved in cell wall biosynthesis
LIIIPCYNEEHSIKQVIEDINLNLPNATIWIIDNNSSDNTAQISKNLGVRVIHVSKQGKGYAVRQAFALLDQKYDVIGMMDGDGTYSSQGFSKGIELIQNKSVDMVVGNRTSHLRKNSGALVYRRGHLIGNKLFSYFFSKMFQIEITDTLSGWRLFSYPFVKSFTDGASGFEIEMELNTHAMLLDSSVVNLDVSYGERMDGSESKLNTYSDGFKILRRVLSMYRSEKPIIAYGFLSLPWILLSAYSIQKVISEFAENGEVLHFPTLIGGVGAFTVGALLGIAGLILQKVRLSRVSVIRSNYILHATEDRWLSKHDS